MIDFQINEAEYETVKTEVSPANVTLVLTLEEAHGLHTLLQCGTSSGTLESLGLGELHRKMQWHLPWWNHTKFSFRFVAHGCRIGE